MMPGLRLRAATAADFRAFAGFDLPEQYCIEGQAVGYAAERAGRIVATGLVSWDLYGRAWGWFNEGERLPVVTMHRCALEMLVMLRDVGEPALHAMCSQTIPGAEKWLRRLGFRSAPELTTDPEHPVWVCSL